MNPRPYSLNSARFLSRGSSDDRSNRTAGMRARTDPALAPVKIKTWPVVPRLLRWWGRRRG